MNAELLSLSYMNKATMLGNPTYDYATDTALQCARECLADPLCKAFQLYRNVEPAAASVSCRRHDELSFVVYDPMSVVYFTRNGTMPFQ